MEPRYYTLEDVTYLTVHGERRGFMAGIVFCVIIHAWIKERKKNSLPERRMQGPY